MSNRLVSHIFSLADPFEYKPEALNKFIELGMAAQDEYHIAIFNKNVIASNLHIDYENAVKPNKFCTVYSIVNGRGSIYGTLFSVDRSRTVIKPHRLVVGLEDSTNDFGIYPYLNEKSNLLFYKDSADTLLVITATPDDCPYLILDDKHAL